MTKTAKPAPASVVELGKVFKETFDEQGKKITLPGSYPALAVKDALKAHIPVPTQGYVFFMTLLRVVLNFLARPHGCGLFLFGPTGSGKTSVITEVAARLGWPTFEVGIHERTEVSDLRGTWIAKADGNGGTQMEFHLGPVLRAFKDGGIAILNEIDTGNPGVLSCLNDLIERRPVFIPETGELLQAHPLFRIVATANSNGSGDESGAYAGVVQQNTALFNRMRSLCVSYAPASVEEEIVSSIFRREGVSAQDASSFAKDMVALANKVRGESTALKGLDGTLNCVLSTRNLCHWAEISLDYAASSGNFLKAGLEEVLLNRCSAADRIAVVGYATAIFGESWAEQ